MPAVLMVMLSVIIVIIWGVISIERIANGYGGYASLVLCGLFGLGTLGTPAYLYTQLPVRQVVKEVQFAGDKAVIADDNYNLIYISKVTGESYKPGDKVEFTLNDKTSCGIDWCQDYQFRMRNIHTVRENYDK